MKESISQLSLTLFLHTEPQHQKVPTTRSQGMEKHLAVKITLRRIKLQRNVNRSMTTSSTDTSATKPFRKAMIEVGRSKKTIKDMDQFASEHHIHNATSVEINVYRGTLVDSHKRGTLRKAPTRYQFEFKNALSTM